MRRVLPFVLCFVLGCVRARERQAEEHLRNEFNFLVPWVDLEAEEKAVRNVLGQRKLVVDETLRGQGFVALSASTLDQRRTAVRIITARGVVSAEDGDLDDMFATSKVAFSSLSTGGPGSELLLGVAKTERGNDLGCALFQRVRPDANLAKVDVHIERFGSRACLAGLTRDPEGTIVARIGWPSLSAGLAPTLSVDVRIDSERLDQSDPEQMSLRIDTDETRFLARERARINDLLAHAATFPDRQAAAVARAALALSTNESVDLQLSAYQSTLGNLAASLEYADLIALTRAHIEHGWDDPVPEGDGAPAPESDTDPGENVIIEPTSEP
jgi:hypothetical protein